MEIRKQVSLQMAPQRIGPLFPLSLCYLGPLLIMPIRLNDIHVTPGFFLKKAKMPANEVMEDGFRESMFYRILLFSASNYLEFIVLQERLPHEAVIF